MPRTLLGHCSCDVGCSANICKPQISAAYKHEHVINVLLLFCRTCRHCQCHQGSSAACGAAGAGALARALAMSPAQLSKAAAACQLHPLRFWRRCRCLCPDPIPSATGDQNPPTLLAYAYSPGCCCKHHTVCEIQHHILLDSH